MAKANLTAERLRELLHYDPETGVFTRKIASGTAKVGDSVGSRMKIGYLEANVGGRKCYMHILAWIHFYGASPKPLMIDHINGDKSDNRISNLRAVTCSVNQQNRKRAEKGNKSGLLGVSPNHKGWAASISINGVRHHLGTYVTPEEAHEVYLSAKRKMHVGNTL